MHYFNFELIRILTKILIKCCQFIWTDSLWFQLNYWTLLLTISASIWLVYFFVELFSLYSSQYARATSFHHQNLFFSLANIAKFIELWWKIMYQLPQNLLKDCKALQNISLHENPISMDQFQQVSSHCIIITFSDIYIYIDILNIYLFWCVLCMVLKLW